MIISKHNNLLYDTKNFDNAKNIYAVLIDNIKVQANIDSIDNYDVLNINITQEKIWLCFSLINSKTYKNPYKVVYGHFYNNSDIFLYKDIHSGKIIGHSIKKTYVDKLYYNKNKLLYNRSYKTLVEQFNRLYNKSKDDYTSTSQLTIHYNYDNETIEFENTAKYIDTVYSDECLILQYTEKTNIIL